MAEISRPEIPLGADPRDRAGIPKGMHFRASVEEVDLGPVAALVAVVADAAVLGPCGDIQVRNPAALGPAWMGASGGSSAAEKRQIQRCGTRLAPV